MINYTINSPEYTLMDVFISPFSPYREIFLGFEWLIIFFCFQFTIIFLKRGFQIRKEKKDSFRHLNLKDEKIASRRLFFIPKEFAWALFFLGFGLMEIFFIFGDFYTQLEIRMIFLFSGYLSAMIAFWFFTFIIEYTEYYKSRLIFTFIFLILINVIIFFMIFIPSIVQTFTFVIWLPVILMLLLFLIQLYKLSKHDKKILFNTILLFVGLVLLSIGFLGTTDFMMQELGEASRLGGDIFQNCGLIVLCLTFHLLPSFEEYEWKDALYALFIIDNYGRNIYFHEFNKYSKDEDSQEVLISGSLVSIKIMLEEMTQKGERPYFNNVKGISLMLAYGKYTTAVLFVDRFLYTLRTKQQKFIKQFEITFQEFLKDWSGELTIFNPTKFIIDEIFS